MPFTHRKEEEDIRPVILEGRAATVTLKSKQHVTIRASACSLLVALLAVGSLVWGLCRLLVNAWPFGFWLSVHLAPAAVAGGEQYVYLWVRAAEFWRDCFQMAHLWALKAVSGILDFMIWE